MKKTTIPFLFFCATGCVTLTAYHPQPDAIWPLVAQSHVIATGTLNVPVDHIRSCLASNQHGYAEISVSMDQAPKGTPPKTFVVRWFTKARDYAPAPDRVIALNGKKAMLFLVDVDDAPVSGYYFAGFTPRALSDAGDAQVEQVRREVTAQQQFLAQFSKAFPPAEEPLYERVKDLVDATTRRDSQMAAFRELEELGQKAVPAIIMLMDDRRDLAVPAILLVNKSPDAFESIRHYGPKKVVDAMDAILNQITGEAFGNICNGGTERERQEAVKGWRTYLSYWKMQTHNKVPEDTARKLADPQHCR
jgi:hypothetical protein